jgi:hypothetical protein
MNPSTNRDRLQRLVLASLADEGVPVEELAKDASEMRLIGQRALVKSIGLVAVLVGVEERLFEELGIRVSLMDEQALSQSRSPFRSVATLVDYLELRLSERGA